MKFIYIFILFFFVTSCSKTKVEFVCGDHKCINKSEAEQYFEENLSIEVRIIDKQQSEEVSLVELNLNEDKNKKRKVRIYAKKEKKDQLKTLSKEQIVEIRKNIKNKKNEKKLVKKSINTNDNLKKKITKDKKELLFKKNVLRKEKPIDVCTILKDCSIDEISKYLENQGRKKKFPDITTRQ